MVNPNAQLLSDFLNQINQEALAASEPKIQEKYIPEAPQNAARSVGSSWPTNPQQLGEETIGWGAQVWGQAANTETPYIPYPPQNFMPNKDVARPKPKKSPMSANVFRRHPRAAAGAVVGVVVVAVATATYASGLLSNDHAQNGIASFSEGSVPPSAKATKFSLPKDTLIGTSAVRVDSSYAPIFLINGSNKLGALQPLDNNGNKILLDAIDARKVQLSLSSVSGAKNTFEVSSDSKIVYVRRSGLQESLGAMPDLSKTLSPCTNTPTLVHNGTCFDGLPATTSIKANKTAGINASEAARVESLLATGKDGKAVDTEFANAVIAKGWAAALGSAPLQACFANSRQLADAAVVNAIHRIDSSVSVIFVKGTTYKGDLEDWTKEPKVAPFVAANTFMLMGTDTQCNNLQAPEGGN